MVRNSSLRRRAVLGLVALLAFYFSMSPKPAHAGSSDSEYRSFIDEIGSMIFALAWPTAEYDHVNFGDVQTTSDGIEITFRVHGRSGFGGGPLWTDVVIEVSDGEITDLHWGANNAILAQPGQTVAALGQALAELNSEHQLNTGSSSSGSTRTGSTPTSVLSNQLATTRRGMESRGYNETHEVYTSSLQPGENKSLNVTLQAGKRYMIIGACDQDCSDLDIRLYSSSGLLLTSDEKEDDRPLVLVTPPRTADYTVRVIMARCSRAPCYFGTQIFGQ